MKEFPQHFIQEVFIKVTGNSIVLRIVLYQFLSMTAHAFKASSYSNMYNQSSQHAKYLIKLEILLRIGNFTDIYVPPA